LTYIVGIASLIDRVDRTEVGLATDGSTYRYHPTFKTLLEASIPLFLKTEKTVSRGSILRSYT